MASAHTETSVVTAEYHYGVIEWDLDDKFWEEYEDEQHELREEKFLAACLEGQPKDLPEVPEEDAFRAEREAAVLAAVKNGIDGSLPAPSEKSEEREKRLTNMLEHIKT